MATRRQTEPKGKPTRRPPATTPERRENQLIAMAVDLAEKQILEGTASSQVLTHFLKLGSSSEKIQQRKAEMEVELLEAKKEALASQARVEELYGEAIKAMRSYAGHEDPEDLFDE